MGTRGNNHLPNCGLRVWAEPFSTVTTSLVHSSALGLAGGWAVGAKKQPQAGRRLGGGFLVDQSLTLIFTSSDQGHSLVLNMSPTLGQALCPLLTILQLGLTGEFCILPT